MKQIISSIYLLKNLVKILVFVNLKTFSLNALFNASLNFNSRLMQDTELLANLVFIKIKCCILHDLNLFTNFKCFFVLLSKN